MGITDAMLKMVDRIVRDEGLTQVSRITVEVGDLSGVVPRFLSDCWEAVADGTAYEKTELKVVSVPGTLRCEDCKAEFAADLENLKCPTCGGWKLTPLTGRDLTILEIEAC